MSEDYTMISQRESIQFDSFSEILRKYKYANMLVDVKAGHAIEVSQPTGLHGETTTLLTMKIANFVYTNMLGRVTVGTGFRVQEYGANQSTVYNVDIAFVGKAKAAKPFKNRIVKLVPDLAIEVIARGESEMALRQKQLSLIAAGTKIVWIVYPDSETVTQFKPDNEKMFKSGDTLSGGDVLPGFELPVREIFAE
jgi:Uma2 family endonuclease